MPSPCPELPGVEVVLSRASPGTVLLRCSHVPSGHVRTSMLPMLRQLVTGAAPASSFPLSISLALFPTSTADEDLHPNYSSGWLCGLPVHPLAGGLPVAASVPHTAGDTEGVCWMND